MMLNPSIISAINYNRPEALKKIHNTSISHIFQTEDKAIWFSTSDGLHRYNGKNLEAFHKSGWKLEVAMGDKRHLWAVMSDGIYRTDAITRAGDLTIETGDLDFTNCKCLARGDSLFVNTANHIYCCNSDSIYLYTSIPENLTITSMLQLSDESILIATDQGKILKMNSTESPTEIHDCSSAIRTIFEDSQHRLWVGLTYGGVICYNSDFTSEKAYFMPIKESRTMCEDKHGNILVGSSDCLYTIHPNGDIVKEEAEHLGAHCITKLLKDSDNNIWIGTFYNGAYYSTSDMCPFYNPHLEGTGKIMLVNDLTMDKRGDIWIVTDQYGTHKLSNGKLEEIPETKDHKSKSILYDLKRDCIWIGRHQASLLCYHPSDKSWKEYPFCLNDTIQNMAGANKMLFLDDEILVGSSHGAWLFNPAKENKITRRLEGYSGLIHDIAVDQQGKIWAGGNGLYAFHDGMFQHIDEMGFISSIAPINKRTVTSISIRGDEIWAATRGYGVLKISNNELHCINSSNSGLPDNKCHLIKCTDDGNIIIGTTAGISVLNENNGHILNFHDDNGLEIGSTREGCMIKINDKEYMVGGTNGLECYDPSKLDFSSKTNRIKIESIQTNHNTTIIYKGEQRIVFDSKQKNFSFNIATYDYTNTLSYIYEYKLEGFDTEWQQFDISSPIRFMYMEHGDYTLVVRSRVQGSKDQTIDQISVNITLKPRWYEATITKVIGIIILLLIVIITLSSTYSRLLLRQELKHKEEEHNERTRFFIRVSHELRTPLSLVIGQLELFLKRNGSRVAGIKHLESTYKHALDIKRIIGNFVEMENQLLSPETDDMPSESELEALLSPDKEINLEPLAHSYTMLIIDDNAAMRSMLRNIFNEEYKIIEAINGADGLELAKSMQPDIIISDVMMPVMDGLTLCAKLRSDFTTSHIPIILLTAHVSEKHNVEGMKIGADDYIAKPFSVDILAARCKNLLTNRQILKDRYNLMKASAAEEDKAIKTDKKDEQFINAVIGAIERHLYSKDLCISTLAEELSVSTSTLNNKISAIYNMSTRVFIEEIKLRHALKMIKEGHNVSETADILGFSSPKYFTIRFKKKYGKSPSNYK